MIQAPAPGLLYLQPGQLPPHLPVVWVASMVAHRLRSLHWRVTHARGEALLPGGRFDPAVCMLAERAGLERDRAVLAREGAWRVRCPACGQLRQALVLVDTQWRCRRQCAWPKGRAWLAARLRFMLGRYAFGMRIGVQRMPARRRVLLRELAALAGRVRRPRDVITLAVGTALLKAGKPRRLARPQDLPPVTAHGPVWQRLGPLYLDAYVDAWLHPEAYRVRVLTEG